MVKESKGNITWNNSHLGVTLALVLRALRAWGGGGMRRGGSCEGQAVELINNDNHFGAIT